MAIFFSYILLKDEFHLNGGTFSCESENAFSSTLLHVGDFGGEGSVDDIVTTTFSMSLPYI